MKFENQWDDAAAAHCMAQAGDDPADRQLALRVYTSRLIGQNPDLVMHGGGNTSVKLTRRDLYGNEVRVLHVKGSGWDLGDIEAPGLPGVLLDPLLELRALDALSDEEMVNQQRRNLLDSSAPNPSVETLLHANLPHVFVDHTHATPFLALANLPDLDAALREIFGDRLAVVPYILPGFGLAKAAAEVFETNPQVEGLLLKNHGHFAFGATARESYDRIIAHTNEVCDWLARRRGPLKPAAAVARGPEPQEILPVLRGLVGDVMAAHQSNPDAAMPVLDLRDGAEVRDFLASRDLADLSRRGVATPDHVLRTKRFPLLLTRDVLASGRAALAGAVETFLQDYRAYFDRNAPRFGGAKTLVSPHPCVAWMEGLGLAGIGATAKAASAAADLAEQTLEVMREGEAAGGFRPIGEADTFDAEYWSLEQAKLGKGVPPVLTGRVVLITGGAGAIGRACAAAFAAQGAQVFLVDREAAALDEALAALGPWHGGAAMDITEPGAAAEALARCVRRFGGIDILLSNAGAATSGDMAGLDEAVLRQSFELNFFAHNAFARAATGVMRAQGRGGQILFNISKQAVNPGRNFGAYGLPKAATFFLLRQLALELGPDGIRVNGVNADRIRSGLLTGDFIAERAEARGTDPDSYMAGNLLGREVEARHVAKAFTDLATSERTTGHVMTVDGGNIEAALR
ncbi:bifunctional aldolase/short-chain dehydrogenase [Maritimibacter sp. 55A14]|uniref:bifunctional aldolase/short-chain dehydrogenase n=1 Tax=Maritimibacter sp. 55A14 TaxID=2174844 RepID=UPI000D61B965|nr:bifunctional aldolase/short-chain dehydrogenase [Maritimibacter sp. 55A14]PWE33034.1 bifunctional aldolase/short-chain dehydrogenase [Maritimibacter sp. 55A14]